MSLDLRSLTLYSLLAWLAFGCVLTVAAGLHILGKPLILLGTVPVVVLVATLWRALVMTSKASHTEKFQIVLLVGIWILHGTGVLVPETGFDAVWYHLPVSQAMLLNRGFVVLPELYQSLNPLFSDLFFEAGLAIGGISGVKVVAYLLSLLLIFVTYQVARLTLTRFWALWVVVSVSTFQVIAWQSTSFYVDIPKALWELGAIWLLFQTNVLPSRLKYGLAGAVFGAALATKAFTFLLIPSLVVMVLVLTKSAEWRRLCEFCMAAGLVVLPFYWRTWYIAGNPLLSIVIHVDKLSEIGGSGSILEYISERLFALPISLVTLTFLVRDYVSLMFLVFLPLVGLHIKSLVRDHRLLLLMIFGVQQYAVWWFVPPLSTRYALSGFIALCMVWIWAVAKTVAQDNRYLRPLVIVLILATGINLAPRILVAKRNLEYIYYRPPISEYVHQFYDGSIDQHLKRWYQLN